MIIEPQRLKQIRKRQEFSRESLSELSGVSERTIARIEANATANPRDATVRNLAKGLGIAVEVLTGNAPLPDSEENKSAHQAARANRRRAARERRSTHVNVHPATLSILRNWRGLTRRALAIETGISERQLSRIEKSRTPTPVRKATAKRLARVLDVEDLSSDDTGELQWPSDLLNAGLEGWWRAPPKVQMSGRVSHHVRLAYDLVQNRYEVSARELMVLAPLMFVLLAEGSLAWRRRRLQDVEDVFDRLSELGAASETDARQLYFTHYSVDIDAGYHLEKESIELGDVAGEKVRNDTSVDLHGREDVYPFEDYLKTFASESGRGDLVEFTRGGRFIPDPFWGTEPYRLFPGWLEDLTGGSDHARWALEYGDVRFTDIPDELMSEDARDERVAWLESRLSDEVKNLMDSTTSFFWKKYITGDAKNLDDVVGDM